MKKTPRSKDAPAPAAPPAIEPDVQAKLDALHVSNSQAAEDLALTFGHERWAAIVRQCEAQGLNAGGIASLCGKMRRTRQEWHPGNDPAALADACIGLLCAIGSVPKDEDVKTLQRCLEPTI